MNGFAEQRMYQRIDNLIYEVSVSRGNEEWLVTEPRDISAVGLRFASSDEFVLNDILLLNVVFYNMLSPFHLTLKGTVIRLDNEGSRPIYVIKFIEVDNKMQVQLDELVRNALTVCCQRDTIPVKEYFAHPQIQKFDSKKG